MAQGSETPRLNVVRVVLGPWSILGSTSTDRNQGTNMLMLGSPAQIDPNQCKLEEALDDLDGLGVVYFDPYRF